MIINITFSKYLTKNKVMTEENIQPILAKAEKENTPIYKTLIQENILPEEEVLDYLAQFLNIEVSSLQINELNIDLVKKFPLDKLIEYRTIPMEEMEDVVYMGTSNPLCIEDISSFRSIIGKKIQVFLFSEENIEKLLNYVSNKFLQKDAVEESELPKKQEKTKEKETKVEIDAPVIKLVDAILREAVVLNASDIHIEPFEDHIRTRYRIDGVLTTMSPIPKNLYPAVLARIKIMASMNIAERRIPQDGKLTLEISGTKYDFRVSTLPMLFGEKIVIRIYDVDYNKADIASLGFDRRQTDLVMKMITRPYGIILLTGPTGSGKSTTLYTFLRYLNKEDTNIITVEDPVENQIDGINQVQINPKADLTFSIALRSILRQDPNIIMIGEIRDEETAQIAARAAITGHLVLSTIHTNDAVGVITRLVNMGVPRYLVADSLLGSISQRLLRRLCPYCKEKKRTDPHEMKILGLSQPKEIYHRKGCKYCNGSGYTGRLGLFEIMLTSKNIKDAIMDENITSQELEDISNKEGKTTLLEEAKRKVLSGDTSIEEYEKLSEFIDLEDEDKK